MDNEVREEQDSTVEIRLYDHSTDKFLYKRLTESEWIIIKALLKDEKWEY